MPLFQKIFASIASSPRCGWPWSQIYETHQCTSKGHQKNQILKQEKQNTSWLHRKNHHESSAFRMYCRSCCVVSVCPETFFILKSMKLPCFTYTRKPQAWPWQKTKSRTLSLFYTSRWVPNLSQLRLIKSAMWIVNFFPDNWISVEPLMSLSPLSPSSKILMSILHKSGSSCPLLM